MEGDAACRAEWNKRLITRVAPRAYKAILLALAGIAGGNSNTKFEFVNKWWQESEAEKLNEEGFYR